GDDVEIKVFFVNPKIANGNDCDTGEFVTRKIPKTTKVADAALRQLFAGPTDAEKQKGMEGIASLGSYYIGVTIKNGKAIVNFKPGAEKYLYVDGPFCMQSGVLTPISKTLTQFSSVKDVDFAINGKIIEDWDA
ncbi:MAG: GerMN domain-containing protein, partial [Acidobacteriota bacterium]